MVKVEYMDNGEWLLTYNTIGYGIFKTAFALNKQNKIEVDIKANDFLDYDTYKFTKE